MRLHLPKTLLAALLACFAALPEYASGAATIVTFGNAGGITGVTTDSMLINDVGAVEKKLSDGSLLSLVPTSSKFWSSSSDGAIKGTWSNSEALTTMNDTLELAENTIGEKYFSDGSDCYYTASGNQGSTSRLTLRLSEDVLVGSEITFFVTATAKSGNLTNFSAAGLQGSSTAYAVNDGDGFSDTPSFSAADLPGYLTLIKYTGTVGGDRTVTFNSTTGKNGWQMLAYKVTSTASVPSYLTWNGTDTANAWNTSDANWQDAASQNTSFTSGSYVRFTSDAANKTAVIDSAITAGAIDVLDNYTFSFGENGSLTCDGVFISAGKTLTKAGSGTWALGVKTVVGDFKVAAGSVTSSGIFDGNLTIDGGNVTYTTTSSNADNKFGGNVSVKKGTLTIEAVQNNGTSIIKAGSEINIGEAGKIVLQGHDLLAWNESAPASINMAGAAGEGNKAVLQIINPGKAFTMSSALNLNGYTEVSEDPFNTYGGNISASGEKNIISSGIRVRNDVTITVSDSSSLEIQGKLQIHRGDGSGTITKAGAGTLTISGEDNTYDRGISVTGGKLNIDSDMSVSKVSVTNGSSLTVGAGKTATITQDGYNGGLILNEAGTSQVILKGKSETDTTGGKLVYDKFTYQASGTENAKIIGNTNGTFKLYDSFNSISNATIALNSDANGVRTIGNGNVGTLKNVTLSNNSTNDLTVSSTAAGKLSIINDDGGTSSTGTGAIIDKTVKPAATALAEVDTSSTDSFESYDQVHAITGNVELYKTGATVSVADMVIGAGRTISVYRGDDTATKASVSISGSLTTMGQSSVLNADLSLDGTTLTLNDGALTLNGSLSMSGVKLVATDYMHWNNIDKDDVLTLFNGVTSIDGFTDGADASTVFTNLGTGDFTLKYNTDGGIVQMVANRAVPEPTTATLSMLALAGLMARRRRRRA